MNNVSSLLRRCLLLLLLTLTITSYGTAQRFEPRIVFASNHDGNWNGNWDIYSMDVDGNNLVQLTDHPGADNHPSGSPDGRRIAFTSRRGLTPDLYVMDSDGTNVIRLTRDNFGEARSSWSPDSGKIAFASFCKLNCDIFTVDANGENRTRLTEHEMENVDPRWSPDGSKIAFVSAPNFGALDPRHIFIMNADGKERRNLTGDTNLKYNLNPTWAPDGRRIAFQSQRPFEGYDIYVITAEGKNLKQLTQEGNNRMPAFSPDGRKIAFASNREGDFNIYLMDTNGRNVVKLTTTPPGTENISPSWLPSPFAVNPRGMLPTSWGVLKRTGNH